MQHLQQHTPDNQSHIILSQCLKGSEVSPINNPVIHKTWYCEVDKETSISCEADKEMCILWISILTNLQVYSAGLQTSASQRVLPSHLYYCRPREWEGWSRGNSWCTPWKQSSRILCLDILQQAHPGIAPVGCTLEPCKTHMERQKKKLFAS